MFDADGKSNNFFSVEPEVDENEGQIFGLEVRHDWNLIGKVYLFCDSLYSLLETINDEAPIITTTGENKGMLKYSIVPKIHEYGEEVSLLDFDDVNQLVG